MKSPGIVRFIDEKGRIVVPMEIRRNHDIQKHDLIEMFLEGDQIIFQPLISPNRCSLTGQQTKNPLLIADGKFTLSEEGAAIVASELSEILKLK